MFRNVSVFGEHVLDCAAVQLAILHGGEPAIFAIKIGLICQLGVIEFPQEGCHCEFTIENYCQFEVELLVYVYGVQCPEVRFTIKLFDIEMVIVWIECEKGYAMCDE